MNYAILLAAGSGRRMESHDLPKCFIKVNDKPIYQYGLDTFLSVPEIDHIIITTHKDFYNEIAFKYKENNKVSVIIGGATRQESVFLALTYLKEKANDDDLVLIHDAARPLISQKIILDNIKTAKKEKACMTAIKTIDTIVNSADFISVNNIPDRKYYYLEQTPATFSYSLIYNAHLRAKENHDFDTSDDCILAMKNNTKIALVEGDRNNFKITNEIDLALFKTIINK